MATNRKRKNTKKIDKKSFKEIFFHNFVIIVFVLLYAVVSIISTVHVIDFFELSNPRWLAISLAVAFEVGAAASLASIIVLGKVDKKLVWFLFILLTAMQAMGNTFYAFTNLENYKDWIDLFGLNEMPVISQKRVLSIVSGSILPIVALGFIKSLVDYMRPESLNDIKEEKPKTEENQPLFQKVEETPKKIEEPKRIEEKPRIVKEIKEKNIEFFKNKSKQAPENDNKKEEKEDIEKLPIIDEKKESKVIEEVKEPPKEENTVKDEKKIEANKDITNFEKELDALKKQLEEEKKKTKFEVELDKIRNEINSEKNKNNALKNKREKEVKKEDVKEEQPKEIKKDIKEEKVNDNSEQKVKEIKIKPIQKRSSNPTRAL